MDGAARESILFELCRLASGNANGSGSGSGGGSGEEIRRALQKQFGDQINSPYALDQSAAANKSGIAIGTGSGGSGSGSGSGGRSISTPPAASRDSRDHKH